MSSEFGSDRQPDARSAVAAAVLAGSAGWTVRCTPHRRTVMVALGDHDIVFCKLRSRRHRDGVREWRWLGELDRLGFRVSTPICRLRRGGLSVVCTARVPGRSVDALLADACRKPSDGGVLGYLCDVVAPMVRRLHDHGLAFRDLYWNHLFAEVLAGSVEPALIDVERVFRPRLRRRRWLVKDLAGLLASAPIALPANWGARFLRAYLGDRVGEWRTWAVAIAAKAERIRSHRPRFG